MLKKFSPFFLLTPLFLVFAYFGWQRWLATSPELLPQKSTDPEDRVLSQGSYYETSIPPTGNDKYLSADYRLWVPENVQTIRGLIVKQHGCGDPAAATGLNHATDLQWQALALKHHFALLGTKLSSGDQSCDDWALIDNGTEKAFLKALHIFAQKSYHSELEKVPWVLWGHSGGADWVAQMLEKHTDRTIAVIEMRCGGVLVPNRPTLLDQDIKPALLGVPVLWALGEKDPNTEECVDLPKKIFAKYRQAGALWALAIEANTAHESGDTRLLAIPYLDTILTMRLMADTTKLRPVNTTQGWLGNIATRTITPATQSSGNLSETSWLPNESTARQWQQYVVGNQFANAVHQFGVNRAEKFGFLLNFIGSTQHLRQSQIAPTRKPAAPSNLRVIKIGETENLLVWNFIPDLENGVPSFRIYRNSQLIRTLQGQNHNFGDAPEPSDIALEFYDKTAKPKSVYTVAAFNDLGESISQAVQSNKIN